MSVRSILGYCAVAVVVTNCCAEQDVEASADGAGTDARGCGDTSSEDAAESKADGSAIDARGCGCSSSEDAPEATAD
jgi:hypothetical protein